MATKLYFGSGFSDVSNFPADQQAGVTPSTRWDPYFSLLPMGPYPVGSGDMFSAVTTVATTALQRALMRAFVSPSLRGSGTIGGGSMALYVAEAESSLSANFWINAINAYVWRPSTGTKVGTLKNNVGGLSLGGAEPSSVNSVQTTYIVGISSSAVNYQSGDCIVVELWSRFVQSVAAANSCEFHFGGSNESLSENVMIGAEGCASFIQFNENVSFWTDQIRNSLMKMGCGM